MTDKALCEATLSTLNGELRTSAASKQMFEKGTFWGYKDKSLVKTKDGVVKHHKILTDFFALFEARAGFNRGMSHVEGQKFEPDQTLIQSIEGELNYYKSIKAKGAEGLAQAKTRELEFAKKPVLPAHPLTLTGGVNAEYFRRYLLKHGYHWKDAGLGSSHGEFTHRLHWFMIVTWYEKGLLKFKGIDRPVDIFKKLAEPCCVGKGDNESVWDRIVDLNNGDDKSKGTFRKPETLHSFLCDEKTQARDDLWVLSQLIAGRSRKRALGKPDYSKLPEGTTFGEGMIYANPKDAKRWGEQPSK